ncbi:MAG: 16S rRNA (guanine(527)-N(7))-methyltransferase RsmG [Sphingomonadales bacterium]|jgi:16S rRNA (guanine527-N7)-methyltransferase
MNEISGPESLRQRVDVSRETLGKIEHYVALLEKWQKRINLIGPSTFDIIWQRHIWDSVQLLEYFPTAGESKNVLDIGSGAGLPAIILALFGPHHFTLVESDGRKCAFLRTVVRELSLGSHVQILQKRVEQLAPKPFDFITCRAFAPLDKIMEYSTPFAHKKTQWVLLKGQDVEEELTKAAISWNMRWKTYPSQSDSRGSILVIKGVVRA